MYSVVVTIELIFLLSNHAFDSLILDKISYNDSFNYRNINLHFLIFLIENEIEFFMQSNYV